MDFSGEQPYKELGAPDLELLPPLSSSLVHHDRPLVWVDSWTNEPVKKLSIVRRGPGDDLTSRQFQLLWFGFTHFPKHLKCLISLAYGTLKVVMAIGAPGLEEPEIPVEPATTIRVDQVNIVPRKPGPELTDHSIPVLTQRRDVRRCH